MESTMLMGSESEIKSYIQSYHQDELRFDNFFLKDVFEKKDGTKLIVNSDSVLNLYYPELVAYRRQMTMTEQETRKYFCNPKRLSYDLYGTTELWFLLLHANEMHSTIEFCINPVYVYNYEIIDLITRARNMEIDSINRNAAAVSDELIAASNE